MDPELVNLIRQVITVYLTLGFMLIGFSLIVQRDSAKAKAWARWWYLRPIELVFITLWRFFLGILKWMVSPLLSKKKKK
jgi:hypothetical protein